MYLPGSDDDHNCDEWNILVEVVSVQTIPRGRTFANAIVKYMIVTDLIIRGVILRDVNVTDATDVIVEEMIWSHTNT